MKLFEINDTVVYGTEGICVIIDITEKCFNSNTQQYYVLRPVYNKSSTIMVPTGNELLVSRMKRTLTEEEANALIASIPEHIAMDWIADEKKRKEACREILQRGDRCELISLVKALYVHSEGQKAIGKKLHASDERFFREAERLLYEEFASALKIEKENVLPYILSKIGKKELDA